MTGEPPSCFGKHWNPQAVECRGGLDPMYTNPRDGSHKREKCQWYERCAPRTCANQMSSNQPQQNVGVSPSRSIMPRSGPQVVQPVVQPQQQPSMMQPSMMQPPAMQHPTQSFAQMVHPSQYAPAYLAQFGQQMLPMNFQQPGMQIPAYLTVPEPIDLTVPWWKRLLTEVVRSMAKGAFHTGANWVDHNPFGRYNPPTQ